MDTKEKIIAITTLSADYCYTLQTCRNFEQEEFIDKMLNLLPRLYLAFTDVSVEDVFEEDEYFETYVDEDFYESIRRNLEILLGPNDTFLETFEENMKYSDSPIAASISECLADIFQPLFNFISYMRDTEGARAIAVYMDCREKFASYWAQTLCNVLRAINNLKYR